MFHLKAPPPSPELGIATYVDRLPHPCFKLVACRHADGKCPYGPVHCHFIHTRDSYWTMIERDEGTAEFRLHLPSTKPPTLYVETRVPFGTKRYDRLIAVVRSETNVTNLRFAIEAAVARADLEDFRLDALPPLSH